MWSARKRVFYFLIVFFIVALVVVLFFVINRKAPSCFDNKQNQNETGVDCGGVCEAVCPNEVVNLTTIWVRPFRVSLGNYAAAALVQNSNLFGVKQLRYRFKLYDSDNLLVNEREGVTYVNPDEQFVIFEPNISTGERDATRAFIEFFEMSP